MLEKLRRGAVKVLVFALFAILIVSFAVWGIGDVVRQSNQGPIVEVGGTPVPAEEFTATLQQRRLMLGRQLGQPLTPEQSRAFGIDAAVLGELVSGAAVSNHAKALGLRISDLTLAEAVRSDPAFHGDGGTFSRAVFDERMRQAGFTEKRYLDNRRLDEIREQLTEALVSGVKPPETLVSVVHRFREETRTVAYIRLDPDKVAQAPAPDEKILRALFEEQKRAFTSPERRKVAVLLVSPDDLRKRAQVTDAEVRSSWEQSRSAWDIPERRRIQQIQFRTKLEAEGEGKAIEGGKSFLMAALEANGAQGRLDQGLIARREISDPAFGTAAFSLELNKLSEPIAVRGGYILMRVTEIEPGRARTFDEVQSEVRRSLEDNKLRELASKLHDDIEDRRGATESREKLKAIATELGLGVLEAAAVDARGNGPDGKPAFTHPEAVRFVTTAFDGDKDTPRETIMLSDNTEAWVEVVDVMPSSTKPFEDVKAEVEKLWRASEARTALTKQSQELVDRIKAGETIEKIATELGLEVRTTVPFRRVRPPDGLSQGAARLAFTLPKGGAGSAASADDKSRVVFVVTVITPAEPPTKEQKDALEQELGQELQRDTLQSYVGVLRERQGVKVNQAVYNRALGLDQTP
jgi:peptidyl-prolyl cis-trans isomerase D